MQTIGANEARANFAELLKRVSAEGERIVIERRGKPRAVLVPLGEEERNEPQIAPASLRKTDALFNKTERLAKLGHLVWDWVEDRCTYCSEELARLHGVSVEKYLERASSLDADLEWIHPEDRAAYRAAVDEMKQLGKGFEIEYRIVRPDGEVRHVLEIGEAVHDHTGRAVEHVGSVQDVTEFKRVEEELGRTRDELELRVAERTAELQLANEALHKEEAKLREILENSPLGVAIVSHSMNGTRLAGDRLFVNSALVRMFGAASRESLIKAKIEDSWVDKGQLKAVEDILKGRRGLVDFEVQRRRLDGSLWWVSMNSRPIRFDDQDCTMVWHFDITARKQAEAALKKSEARLAKALQQAKLAYWSYSLAEREIEEWSGEAANILGIAAKDLPKRFETYLELVHPDDREGVAGVYEVADPANPKRDPYQIEYRITRPDGGIVWLLESSEVEYGEDGAPIGYLGTIQDITALNRAEAALRESERRYRELFDESPVAIWEEDWSLIKQMLDDLAQGGVQDWRRYFNSHRDQLRTAYDLAKITEVSRATVEMYGAADKEELASWSVTEFVTDEELAAFCEVVLSFLAGQMTVEIESRDTAFHKPEIIIRRRVVMPPKYRDDWSRIIYAIEDITHRARVEEQLRQAQKMEAVGQLTGGVAHDFNNLLAIVLGNAELLSVKVGEDDPKIQAVIRAATRGAKLTQRLLAFSRIQALQPQVIEASALISGMMELLGWTLGETIEIETRLAPDLWKASADPGQLENALLNLAINARDAMPDGGKLTIECANAVLDEAYVAENPDVKAGHYVVLAVSDTGSGMSAEVQARAFEPFFSTKEVGQGSGLGLSMIYGFAKQSGGHVSIYSEEGQGTTVKLYLPRAQGAVKAEEAPPSEEVPQGRGERILVIEDDPDVRDLAVNMLEGLGYRVTDVPDAASAHKVLAEGKPVDLVLSDVVLPGGTSGPEFAEETRATYPDLKIIFMSGYPAEAAKRNGFLGSDNVLLNKPFQNQQLAKALRHELDGSSTK